ncbi:spore-associated protein A [Actinomadura harenae]|uniref:spore-associated protein A n=1 Tax=Actinomadura harenae TaxID=2483351 RepID=UPI0018F5A397|nr:spore-associated protein A [Actinomadura harenae]
MKRIAVLSLAAAAATTGLGALAAAPASAASASAICGSGYSVVDSQSLNGSTVYLSYSSSSGKNCVVTIKTRDVGSSTRTGAYLNVQGSAPIYESDNYTTYAGPVYANAAGKCVIWGGGTNYQYWYSDWSHCG